jgi:hypothetical protein
MEFGCAVGAYSWLKVFSGFLKMISHMASIAAVPGMCACAE